MESNLVVTLLCSFFGGGTIGGIIMYLIKRKDRVLELIEKTDRQAEGINTISTSLLMLLEALHEQGVINGQSEHIRKELNNYLIECTSKGYYVRKDT